MREWDSPLTKTGCITAYPPSTIRYKRDQVVLESRRINGIILYVRNSPFLS